jgi:Uma2 family endonuclease
MGHMVAALLTADEYILTAETRHRWTELVNGEVIVNTPTVRHQRIVQFINAQLFNWVGNGVGRGEAPGSIDVRFDDATVMAPDCLWFSEGVLPPDDAAASLVVPQLVVEVRSPSTWNYDTTVKLRKYETAGVAEVWMVDTASNSVLVYSRSSTESLLFDVSKELDVGKSLGSPLLDGFIIDVRELFDR